MISNRYQYIATATGKSLQWRYDLLSILCFITSGLNFGWPSPSIPKLHESRLHCTNEECFWVAAMPLVSSIFGAIFSWTSLDRIGRQKTILVSGVPHSVCWLMIAFGKRVEFIYCARFLAGLGDGISFTAVPVYLAEIANPGIRGLLGSSSAVSMGLGVLLINVLGLYLSISTAALISTLLPILLMVTFCFMPESPYYLIMKDRCEDAKACFKILKGIEDVDREFDRLVTSVKEDASNAGHFFDLFTVANNRKALLITNGLRLLQQLSGITAITFYTETIFQKTGQRISAELTTVIYYVVQLVMMCLSSLIMDKAGRRPLMLISTAGTAFTLMAEGIYFYLETNTKVDLTRFSFVPVVALIFFNISYSIGLGTVPLLILGELFPTNVKAFAMCLSHIACSISAWAVSKFFQIVKDDYGMYIPFVVFSICCFLGMLLIIRYLPETKDKTLEEIQDELKVSRKTI